MRHKNRLQSKCLPKAWQNCQIKSGRPYKKRERRDKRVMDSRESKLNRERLRARFDLGAVA
jgi:hypothetical protein